MAIYDLVIVGGGNLGLWTARQLTERGFSRIAVCERGWAGGGATTRSAGMVRQQGGSLTAAKLGKISHDLYLELGEEIGLDSGYHENGYYIVAHSKEEKEVFLKLNKIRQEAGVDNEWIEPEEGKRRFPDLDWSLFTGATYAKEDGYVQPSVAARNITYAVLASEGVDLFEMCDVTSIEERGGGYAVETTRGLFEAERVVDAGGPRGTKNVGGMVGLDIPVEAVRHQIVTFPHLPESKKRPMPLMFNVSKGYYVRPEEEGVLLGMSNAQDEADSSGRYQIDYDWSFHEKLRSTWEAEFPSLAGLPISRAWAASIDYTPDHLPIIDEPREGFYVLAAGGHGMMWGPALGEKMAELVADGAVSDLPKDDIDLGRFGREKDPDKIEDMIALPFPK